MFSLELTLNAAKGVILDKYNVTNPEDYTIEIIENKILNQKAILIEQKEKTYGELKYS